VGSFLAIAFGRNAAARNATSTPVLCTLPARLVTALADAKQKDASSRSHDAVIRVYDDAGNVIETHKHKGEFREW
jgi:hypothetical protein